MSHQFDPHTTGIWIALASAGGVVRFIAETMKSKAKYSFKVFVLLLTGNCVVSGFAGFMTAIIISSFTEDHNLHVVASGVGGYASTEMMSFLSKFLQRKISHTSNQ